MYLRRLHVNNVKLLRDVKIDFTKGDGEPRMWTVLVGENRLCKTTLLQTIAAAAAGVDRGTQLVADVIASWPDLRNPTAPVSIDAEFGFSAARHAARRYPGEAEGAPPPGKVLLDAHLTLEPDKRIFGGGSGYVPGAGPILFRPHDPGKSRVLQTHYPDPLGAARAQGLRDWFVAGYGPSRLLPTAGKSARQSEPTLDRLRPLFGESPIGTGFVDLLGEDLGRAFADVLQAVFVGGGLLPHVTGVDLKGRGGIRSARDLADAQRFEMDLLDTKGARIRVPATWLSQGYQSLITWLADLVGQILLEAGEPIAAADMEGTVLIDEIDLHLHPTWQVRLIPALRAAFPRLQFIATTHSPMILPSLAAEEVILLSQGEDGSVQAAPSARSPALLTGTELLDAFFEIRKLYPDPLGEKLHRYGYLATDPTRSPEEDATMWSLKKELEAAGVTFDWQPVDREKEG